MNSARMLRKMHIYTGCTRKFVSGVSTVAE